VLSAEVDALAKRLAVLLTGTSVESQFHLETALRAAETGSVGGTLLVQLPRREREHAVVKWAGGTQALNLPL
jgi:hypothetical protein